MSNLQRMVVMPPDTFDRWKKIVLEDTKLSCLDKELKNILYNTKLNDISKWQLYRQNLFRYLNSKLNRHNGFAKSPLNSTETRKLYIRDVDTQTKKKSVRNKKEQTLSPCRESVGIQTKLLPERQSFGTQTSFRPMKTLEPIQPIEEIFGDSSRFSSLEMEDNDVDDDDDDVSEELLDMDEDVREKALQGQPSSVKISRERKSLDPTEYRSFELSNGDSITVPVEKQMVTRLNLRRGIHPDKSQTILDFSHRKKKSSTPKKSNKKKKSPPEKKKKIPWQRL